jgi:hypothetical protein
LVGDHRYTLSAAVIGEDVQARSASVGPPAHGAELLWHAPVIGVDSRPKIHDLKIAEDGYERVGKFRWHGCVHITDFDSRRRQQRCAANAS